MSASRARSHPVLLAVALALAYAPLGAQSPIARVTLEVTSDDGPVSDATARAARARAVTDSRGRAVLALAPGERRIVVAKLGYRPDTLALLLRGGADTTVVVRLEELPEVLAPVVVTTTRFEHQIDREPERVEVLAGEEIDEKSQMRPANLTTLLNEMSGVRIQPTAAATGAAGVRVQGLRAQYTQLLSDGLPLYGSVPSGLGLLQIPPLDLRQAEVIKGASTALYGPAALGGVVNLVSKRPGDERAVVLNQTSRGGTDALAWVSDSMSARWGYTLLAGAHHQRLVERSDDDWAALPRFTRGEIRPRLFWRNATGASVLTTVGAMRETREGGSPASIDPDDPFPISVATTRLDGGLLARIPGAGVGTLQLRGAASGRWQDHERESASLADAVSTLFAEASYAGATPKVEWLLGTAVQRVAYRNDDLPALDFTHLAPALFGQVTLTPRWWLASTVSGRCDMHDEYDTRCSPRLSTLVRLDSTWSVRVSGGAGFFAPTLFTEEVENIDLRLLVPPRGLAAERARTVSLDVNARRGSIEVNATLFAADVERPVMLVPLEDGSGRVTLRNAAGTLRTRGVEVYGIYDEEPFAVIAYWSRLRATEPSLDDGGRRTVPLDPRQTFGVDLAYEKPEVGRRVAVEIFHTGQQMLEYAADGDYTAPAFTTYEFLVTHRVGSVQLWLNAENLTDVRQGRHAPLRLPVPGPGGRVAVDQWAPLEGRMVNAGVRIAF